MMAVKISPLDLMLDVENPRFVVLANRDQANIRRYLVTYEDVCQLAVGINNYGSLLPGERIVVLKQDEKYIVIEGNRRTCSLQMLLSKNLIPDGFGHKIPATLNKVKENCKLIEVDVLPNREAALELMAKRHISGVKQWKPIAKKQFFSLNYQAGQSISTLSRITGIKGSEIKEDIRDYKFFLVEYNKYRNNNPDFDSEIINLKIDPFLRIFKARFNFQSVEKIRPVEFLKITYDEDYNTISQLLSEDLFNQITQLVFYETIITERINTRNFLPDVNGINTFLMKVIESQKASADDNEPESIPSEEHKNNENTDGGSDMQQDRQSTPPRTDIFLNFGENTSGSSSDNNEPPNNVNSDSDGNKTDNSRGRSGGPVPGGPSPRTFFETISWDGKLDPSEPSHQGLIFALDELYRLSRTNIGRQKAYQAFSIATGMILRTVYEQSLILRLKQINLWGNYYSTIAPSSFPTLSGIEGFIKTGGNKAVVFPSKDMIDAFDRVIARSHRSFLNANTHNPGNISVHPDSLESIAQGGLFF